MTATVALGDLLTDIRPGFACGDNLNEGVFQIRMHNISRDGELLLESRRRISPQNKQIAKALLEQDDVLFNATNSPELVGKTAIFLGCDEPAAFSNHFIRLRAHEDRLDSRYLTRWLHREFQRGYFRAKAKQWVNQATFSKDRLVQMQIPLPPIEEQRRIAAVLDAAEALRAMRRQVLAKIDLLKSSVVFGVLDGLGNRQPLGDHLKFVTSGSRGWAKFYSDSGSRFIRSQDVHLGAIDDADPAYVCPPNSSEARRTRISTSDLLITITGVVGKVAIAPSDLDGAYISQHVSLIRLSESLKPAFAEAFMCSQEGQRQLARAQYGQTKPGLNLTQIRELLVPIPSLRQQGALIEKLKRVEVYHKASRESATKLDALFASLQQRAFQGEL